ncbi:MAG: hypothetical protein ABI851_06910 [Saprospiraceae bacterium]
MELRKDYFDWIEDYLEGRLNEEQRSEFETELQHNETLKEAIENFPLAKKLSAALIEDEVREKLAALKSSKSRNFYSSPWIRIAAILIIGMCGYFLYKISAPEFNPDHQEMFAYLYIQPAQISVRGNESNLSKLDTAILLFEQEHFKESTSLLLSQNSETEDSLQIFKYLAHGYLRLSDYANSKKYFQKISNSKNELTQFDAQYHLLIIDLLEDHKVDAEIKFDSLKNKSFLSSSKLDYLKKVLKK